MKTVAIIQARMTSTRLPGKVLADLAGEPLLAYMLRRVRRAERLDAVWVATTLNPPDDPVAQLCREMQAPVFRGEEADVLGRYAAAAAEAKADTIVRLTADCPMIDPGLIDEAVGLFHAGGFDYLSNSIQLSYPDGLDVEVFSRAALDRANVEAKLPFHREHVTPYLRTGVYDDIPSGQFKVGHMRAPADFSHLRWTVDTPEDLARVRALVGHLPADHGWLDAVAIVTRRSGSSGGIDAGPANVSLRPATAADSDLLLDWVNQPDSLANKIVTDGPIRRETHEVWMDAKLDSADAAIWIGEIDGVPMGQVRLERRGEVLEVDIYVDPQARGQGAGRAMLEGVRLEAAERWPGTPLLARIKPDNRPSRRLFAQAGYGGMTVARDHLILRREPAELLDLRTAEKCGPARRRFDRSGALFERALQVIPTASQTFSKAASSTVEGAAPLFLQRGEGARVWDPDGNVYIDYVLGLLPVILGYRDPDVDGAIRAQLDRGITFSLASQLEADLAERLVELIPCAEMVRFGKNGSDATSAAIRLARAYTARDKVAICGYHGWHDWYIGTTARHLGVPEAVRDLSVAFPFNDPGALEALLKAEPDRFAAVILEPDGLDAPLSGFLDAVRGLCDTYGVVLVFDEIITGFRRHMGGAQAVHGVTPDLASFGKAMANGMPISAIVGRRGIMRLMEDIFFSTTFGGEALSLAAAIATIDKLRRNDAPARFVAMGARLRAGVAASLEAHGLTRELAQKGGDWWPAVVPTGKGRGDANLIGSLLKQELIEEGILMGPTFNLCLAHGAAGVIEETLAAWNAAAGRLSEALASNDPAGRLRGKPMQPVFQVRRHRVED